MGTGSSFGQSTFLLFWGVFLFASLVNVQKMGSIVAIGCWQGQGLFFFSKASSGGGFLWLQTKPRGSGLSTQALKQYEAALAPLLAARPGAELPRLYMLLETLLCHALLLYLTPRPLPGPACLDGSHAVCFLERGCGGVPHATGMGVAQQVQKTLNGFCFESR